MVKLAIIGAGFIGEVHANCYLQISNAHIVGIVDKVKEKGIKLANKLQTEYFSDIDYLLNNENVDAVDICTPTFLHADMVKKAANAKKHVFCEKPIALTVKDADEMINIINKNKVKGMVGHVLRFWPEYVKVKEIIESKSLGKPLHAFCERLSVMPDWHEGNWGFNEKYSGGAAIDFHIHDLDYLIWLFGKPKLVNSQGVYNPNLGGFTHIATNIEFENGEVGLAECGWNFIGSFPFTMVLRILCENGVIDWIFRAGKNVEERLQKSNLIIYRRDGSTQIIEVEQKDAFLAECEYFINCIDKNIPLENSTMEDGKKDLELAIIATESAKQKKYFKL
jgi:predicted dehydrogenase